MPVLEDIKHVVEKFTGFRRPLAGDFRTLTRKANTYRFTDDGVTPNNPHFPLILYRSPVKLDPAFDPAAIFEVLFASNGWRDSWRDGIYDFLHFHTHTHEVLGIAKGHARVEFGGAKGRRLTLKAGDVVVLPAGTGHKCLSSSGNLLVVGAYPGHRTYDEPKPSEVDHARAVASIAKVAPPKNDPVYGSAGPLKSLWRSP